MCNIKINTADAVYDCDGTIVLGAPEEKRPFIQIVMDALETEQSLVKPTVDENVKTYLSGALAQMSDMVCEVFKRFEAQYGYIFMDYSPWIWGMATDLQEYTKPLIFQNNPMTHEEIEDDLKERISGYQVLDDKIVVVYLDYVAEECGCAIDPLIFEDPLLVRKKLLEYVLIDVQGSNKVLEEHIKTIKWIPSEEDEENFRKMTLLGKRLEAFIKSDGKELYAE